MPAKKKPAAEFKEYPEPEFPDEKARSAYRKAKGIIREAWDRMQAGEAEVDLEADLEDLGLSALPPEIGQLTMLKDLSLFGNQLTALPPEIGQLSALRAFTIADNEITELPSEIGKLASLKELFLENNQLTALPPEIGQLTALTWLSLENNQLTALPPEIGQLTALTRLDLDNNQVTALPPETGQLSALTVLSLQNNQVTALPPEIGQLTALTELISDDNQLVALPVALGECRRLEKLSLLRNGLVELPEELRRLPELAYLLLHGNPGLQIPAEILGSDPGTGWGEPTAQAVLDHYFARQKQGDRPLNEARLVLVGRGGAGKTSMVQRLVRNEFNPQQDSTPGIALSDWKVNDCGGGPVTVHVWDFAGQVITHSMHRYFLSHRTVYVLVLTAREDAADEDAEYWLSLIRSYGGSGEEQGPPVLVALNKSDAARVKVDRGALQERYPFIAGWVETDCESGRGIAELRSAFCKVLEREDVAKWVREGYPAQWWKLKERLYQEQQTRPHLTFEEFAQLCEECGVPEPRQAGVSLHTMGLALNYGLDPRWKEVLADTTVLSPSWVTHHCYNLIRHAETHAGLLYRAELETVLAPTRGGVKGEPDAAKHLYLMRLMERFEAAYPLGDEWPPPHWLVPLGLPDSQPQGRGIEEFGKLVPADAARLRYTYPSVPPGLVAQFIVRTHPLVEPEMQWAKGAVLALNGARALVRVVSKTVVEVTAMGVDKDARRDLAGLCRENLRALHRQVEGLEVQETTEVEAEGEVVWVSVKTLEKDEQKGKKETAVATEEGSVMVSTGKELDEFGTREGRLPEKGKGFSASIGQFIRMPLSETKPRLFISYSHKDERMRKTLELYLEVLKIQGLVYQAWHDRMIQPGMDWDADIARNLEEADVVLLLVSTPFLASGYIQEKELRPALERHLAGKARVIPILLERCDWVNTFAAAPPLCDLPEPKRRVPQGIPRDSKTIRAYSPHSDGWHVVQTELAKVLAEVKAGLK